MLLRKLQTIHCVSAFQADLSDTEQASIDIGFHFAQSNLRDYLSQTWKSSLYNNLDLEQIRMRQE